MSKARRLFELDEAIADKEAYRMCKRKAKFKSSEASYYADKHGQRKYECPVCGHWHLTKRGKNDKA